MSSLYTPLRLLKATAAGFAAAFLVSVLYWMSPVAYQAFLPIQDAYEARAALQANFPYPGVYLLPDPNMPVDTKMPSPVAAVFVSRSSGFTLSWQRIFLGAAHLFVISLLITGALAYLQPRLSTWQSKSYLVLSLLLGSAAALLVNFTEPIWFFYPWSWHWRLALYHSIVWTSITLVSAIFLRHGVARKTLPASQHDPLSSSLEKPQTSLE